MSETGEFKKHKSVVLSERELSPAFLNGQRTKKKSILVVKNRSTDPSFLTDENYHRGSSKATIQWGEGVTEKTMEEKLKGHRKSRLYALGLLMAKGSECKLRHPEGVMGKDNKKALSKNLLPIEGFDEQAHSRNDSVMRELWYSSLYKSQDGGIELTLDQQTRLEILKHKIKADNDRYLMSHPELNILLSLIYRKLLKTKPDNPKLFVANYVHYLNTHREDLVLDEVDVPFDRPMPQEKESEEDGERREIELFAREILQECFDLAAHGAAFVNVKNIIDSLLRKVSPSDEDMLSDSLKSSEEAVADILESMVTSVALARTTSAELVVEEIMDSVMENVCPSIRRDSEVYLGVKESVEQFVRNLLKTVTDKVAKQVKLQERLAELHKKVSVLTNVNVATVLSNLSTQKTKKPILKTFAPIPSSSIQRTTGFGVKFDDVPRT